MPLTNLADFETRVYSAAAGLSCSGLPVCAERFSTSLAMLGGLFEDG
jgi:hypothetical protein